VSLPTSRAAVRSHRQHSSQILGAILVANTTCRWHTSLRCVCLQATSTRRLLPISAGTDRILIEDRVSSDDRESIDRRLDEPNAQCALRKSGATREFVNSKRIRTIRTLSWYSGSESCSSASAQCACAGEFDQPWVHDELLGAGNRGLIARPAAVCMWLRLKGTWRRTGGVISLTSVVARRRAKNDHAVAKTGAIRPER
jgi:hypothetical protein